MFQYYGSDSVTKLRASTAFHSKLKCDRIKYKDIHCLYNLKTKPHSKCGSLKTTEQGKTHTQKHSNRFLLSKCKCDPQRQMSERKCDLCLLQSQMVVKNTVSIVYALVSDLYEHRYWVHADSMIAPGKYACAAH